MRTNDACIMENQDGGSVGDEVISINSIAFEI